MFVRLLHLVFFFFARRKCISLTHTASSSSLASAWLLPPSHPRGKNHTRLQCVSIHPCAVGASSGDGGDADGNPIAHTPALALCNRRHMGISRPATACCTYVHTYICEQNHVFLLSFSLAGFDLGSGGGGHHAHTTGLSPSPTSRQQRMYVCRHVALFLDVP